MVSGTTPRYRATSSTFMIRVTVATPFTEVKLTPALPAPAGSSEESICKIIGGLLSFVNSFWGLEDCCGPAGNKEPPGSGRPACLHGSKGLAEHQGHASI